MDLCPKRFFLNLIGLIVITLSLTSCYKSYSIKSTPLIASGIFPAPPAHKHKVDFYLPNDTVSDSSFTLITDLTVADWPDTKSEKYAEEMTSLAQGNGVDVVKLKNWETEVNSKEIPIKRLKDLDTDMINTWIT